jgi:ubiquinol-cytochrome c reductase subunit 9
MSFTKTIYNLFFRRSATIALATVVGVFAYERVINKSAEYIYERRNQGKLWKHVQPSFKLKTDDDEDETPGPSQDREDSEPQSDQDQEKNKKGKDA